MSSTLRDLFHHNAWATDVLIDVCRGLDEQQLNTTTPGVYGNPQATLQHMVLAEGWYQHLLTGVSPSREWTPGTELTLDEIAERAAELAERWETFLNSDIDVDRMIPDSEDDGTELETPAGVVLTQVFNHGNEHRGQICTILTVLGLEPPLIDAWAYGRASGREIVRKSAG